MFSVIQDIRKTYKNLAMINNQMERVWKEAVLAYLQILTSLFSGDVE